MNKAVEVLGTSTRSVMTHIHASRIALKLLFNGFRYEDLPANMSQAYALHCALTKKLGDYNDQHLIEAWNEVLENIPRYKRTGTSIKELISPTVVKKEELYTKVKLPVKVYNELLSVCYKASIPVVKGIEVVIHTLTNGLKKQEIKAYINRSDAKKWHRPKPVKTRKDGE